MSEPVRRFNVDPAEIISHCQPYSVHTTAGFSGVTIARSMTSSTMTLLMHPFNQLVLHVENKRFIGTDLLRRQRCGHAPVPGDYRA
jgi:hypothetical protein